MNMRILYAGLPLMLLSAGANAQGVVTERPLQLTQDQQTTVYRTIVRESAVPQSRPMARKQVTQSKQIIRKPGGNVVRTTTTERIVTAPAPVARVPAPIVRERVIAAPVATPTPTFVTADPLDLTPDQRNVVYRTLVQQPVQPAPVVTEQRIVTAPGMRPYVTSDPLVEQRVVTVPQTTGAATIVTDQLSGEIVIGSRIPASVPLYVMPPETIAAVPSMESYRYALIDGRVYLVDPRDGIVAAMLYQ